MSLIKEVYEKHLAEKGSNNFLKQYKKAYYLLTDQEVNLYKGGFYEGYSLALKTRSDVIEQVAKQRFNTKPSNEIVGYQFRKPNQNVIDSVLNKVCVKYEIKKEDLFAKKRTKDIVRARNIIHNILNEKYKMTLTDIGKIFNQDHTTVLYSIQMKFNGKRYWGLDQTIWQEFDELTKS
jgi:hypothetical protein|tara:strand:- start:28 stop:561 length:534 start_codon:yes stop_codon:yes gene_type:complete